MIRILPAGDQSFALFSGEAQVIRLGQQALGSHGLDARGELALADRDDRAVGLYEVHKIVESAAFSVDDIHGAMRLCLQYRQQGRDGVESFDVWMLLQVNFEAPSPAWGLTAPLRAKCLQDVDEGYWPLIQNEQGNGSTLAHKIGRIAKECLKGEGAIQISRLGKLLVGTDE